MVKLWQLGVLRISNRIFREVVANLVVHREFSNTLPAKFIIEEGRVMTENWNRPHGHGLIDPAVFTPFPKNPVIAKFFKEIGWVDELGSGWGTPLSTQRFIATVKTCTGKNY